MQHLRSDRLASAIRTLRLAGLTAILCGALVALGAVKASAEEDCPIVPITADTPTSEIPGTECYIGHDEPIVSFYSSVPGSGSNMTWRFILPTERTATPATYSSNTPNPTQSYQLYFHHQFYLVVCNPDSTGASSPGPQSPCTPNSDANSATAGASLLELKFLPPGLPTNVNYTCSNRTTTQWCAIAQIQINNGCPSVPVNLAWITTNGRTPQPVFAFPPPSAPTNVFVMNQGDTIRLSLSDTPNGLLIVIIDETTHTTGYLTTSAANGFGTTDSQTCTNHSFTYRAMWNTASCQELTACGGVARGYTPFGAFAAYLNVAWGPEIGHSEANGSSGATNCDTTTNAPSGTWCFTLTNTGDNDFDGPSYVAAAWPPGANGPGSAMQIISPIGTGFGPTSSNQLYTHMRFTAGSGAGAPDANAAPFYPYYSFLQPAGSPAGQGCSMVLGNFAQGSNNSVNDFGKINQYGTPPINTSLPAGPLRTRPC